MLDIGLEVHGGDNAPYVFVDLKGKSSWDMFSKILEEAQVVAFAGTVRVGGLNPRVVRVDPPTRSREIKYMFFQI